MWSLWEGEGEERDLLSFERDLSLDFSASLDLWRSLDLSLSLDPSLFLDLLSSSDPSREDFFFADEDDRFLLLPLDSWRVSRWMPYASAALPRV